MRTVQLFGLDFYNGKLEEALNEVFHYLESGIDSKRLIFTPNPEMLVAASKDPRFDAVLKSAWLKFPDGAGVLLAARFIQRVRMVGRITGVDFMKAFLDRNRIHRVFLLGADEGVADIVRDLYPDSRIVGTSSARSDDPAIIEAINNSGAEVLFVAFGAPTQEVWLHENIAKLHSVRLGLGVGGAFDFMAGKQTRAPLVFRTLGLEWMWRLFKQPKRWRRIFNAVVVFPIKVLRGRI